MSRYLAVALISLSAAFNLLQQFPSLQSIWPVVMRWSDPAVQARMLLSADGVPYDLMRESDALLPRDAVVLLVTSGLDVRHREYTTFHRALYALAPHAVWWLAPAPPDGTWESGWWIAAPLTLEAVRAVAREKDATHVLVGDFVPSFDIGQKIFQSDEGALFQIADAPSMSAPAGRDGIGVLWPLQLGAAIVVVWLLGDTCLALMARIGFRARGVERATLAWVFGVGVTTLGMLWLNVMGLRLTQQIVGLTAAALVGVLGRWKLRVSPSPRPSVVPLPVWERGWREGLLSKSFASFLFLILSLQITLVAVTAVGAPLRFWDSWVTWGMKARTIFVESAITPSLYLDASRAVTHLDYPWLVPLAEAWLYGWLGAADDRWAGLVSLAFYLALIGIGYATVRRWGGATPAALLTATIIATLVPIAHAAGGAFADVPLAVLVTIAGVYLNDWLAGAPSSTLIVAALAAGLMPWTKREGWLLVGAVCLALLIVGRSRRAWRGVGVIVISAALLSGPWSLFLAMQGVSNTDFLSVAPDTFLENVNRLPFIAWQMVLDLISPGWNFVWLFGAALSAMRIKPDGLGKPFGKLRSGPVRSLNLLPLTALIYLIVISLSYMFSSHAPYQQHVLTSLDRLIGHVTPLVVLWLARRTLVPVGGV